MIVTLVVRSGKHAGQQIRLAREDFLIGRGDQCHLRPRNEAVSRLHCGIFVKSDKVILKDFGSKNGTFVNGQRVVGETELHTGDLLQVADLVFEVQLAREEAKAAVVAPAAGARADSKSAPAVAAGSRSSRPDDVDLMSLIGPPELGSSPTKAFDPSVGGLGQYLEETVVGQRELDTVVGRPAAPDNQPGGSQQPADEVRVVGVAKDRWKPKYANPREAAADALRKFFGKS
ncbi:MAG: FHA domain-containing protein [Thermoguttaceae bacterium]|nr:FHA domain-containing protein [Thermoguttaceae bacterium]MDW8078757.1 FHA domain-containing protein [Thermoguttaceae bacterium]